MEINEKSLYRFINALLLMFCVILCPVELLTLGRMGIETLTFGHYLAGIAVVALVTAWFQLSRKGRMILATAIILSLGITRTEMFRDSDISAGYYSVMLIALSCCVFSMIAAHKPVLGVIAAGILLVFLGVDLFGKRQLPHIGAVCVLLYAAMIYAEWSESLWKKERIANNKHYMIRILPFWALYFVLMAVMPAPEKPYDWQFVKDAYGSVREVFLQISRNWLNADREDFAFGTSGFDEDGRIGGNVLDSEKSVMVIQGQNSLKTNVYLTGRVFNSFDGRCWYSTDESDADDRQLDAFETLYAVNCLDASGVSNYIERTRLSIWYDDFRTGYLFAPLKTIKLQNVEEKDYFSSGGSYLFSEKQGYGRTYNTFFYQINVDHPLVYALLNKVGEGQFEDKEAVFKDIQKDYFTRPKYTLADLDNHREHLYSCYNQPVELSGKVRELLFQTTKQEETDIDKLRAIEDMLQQMTYTKEPGDLPEWVDSESEFLDYFLLESRQGYCVYYATAFVLLARAQGFPARYVEGFCVPAEKTQKTVVTSNMAHAWPEIYVDHVGWIPFEPTPGYEEIRYTPWEVLTEDKQDGGQGSGELSDGTPIEQEAEENEIYPPNQEPAEVFSDIDSGKVMRITGLTLVLAIVVSAVVFCTDWLIRRRRIKRYSLEERFIFEVNANMQILAALGYERRDNETLSELRVRAWAVMDSEETDNKPEFEFLRLYEEYLYGGYTVNQEILAAVMTEKQYLLQMLRRWKPIMYAFFRLYYNFLSVD